jgi:hypothetical protein
MPIRLFDLMLMAHIAQTMLTFDYRDWLKKAVKT